LSGRINAEDARLDASKEREHRRAISRRALLTLASVAVAGTGIAYVTTGADDRRLPLPVPPAPSFACRTPDRTINYVAPHVDNNLVSKERNYYSKMAETRSSQMPHTVELQASRGYISGSVFQRIEVDPHDLTGYPVEKLRIPIKGISYVVGMKGWDMPPVSHEEMQECLTVIRDELGCNGIRIVGDYEEQLIECAEACLSKFVMILLSPYCREMKLEEVDNFISTLAADFEKLRQKSSSTRLILSVGNELTFEMRGMVPGATYNDRDAYVSEHGLTDEQMNHLNTVVKELTTTASQHFEGELTYQSAMVEGKRIDWNNIGVDVISPHRYFETEWVNEQDYLDIIEWFTHVAPQKPVLISEFGYYTFDDALRWGASGYLVVKNSQAKYSQEAQAAALKKNIELLNQTSVGGMFLWDFIEKEEDDRRNPGVIRYSGKSGWARKLSFYEYQRWRV
jgi:hypothetical protein